MTTNPAALEHTAVDGLRALIALCGDDPNRDGLADTPTRVVRAMVTSTRRAGMPTPEDLLARQFSVDTDDTAVRGEVDQMVTVGPIAFASTCEHHLLPFSGLAWVGYIPPGPTVIGLSKFARLVDYYAAGLQVQERLTGQVVAAMVKHGGIDDAACLIEAAHTCMTTRGACKPGSLTVTSDMRGVFRDSAKARSEFLDFTKRRPVAA